MVAGQGLQKFHRFLGAVHLSTLADPRRVLTQQESGLMRKKWLQGSQHSHICIFFQECFQLRRDWNRHPTTRCKSGVLEFRCVCKAHLLGSEWRGESHTIRRAGSKAVAQNSRLHFGDAPGLVKKRERFQIDFDRAHTGRRGENNGAVLCLLSRREVRKEALVRRTSCVSATTRRCASVRHGTVGASHGSVRIGADLHAQSGTEVCPKGQGHGATTDDVQHTRYRVIYSLVVNTTLLVGQGGRIAEDSALHRSGEFDCAKCASVPTRGINVEVQSQCFVVGECIRNRRVIK
mmetsp:Transcript_10136/g.17592  ORF Transcript_10136/g.17592 Transcript_10136/m.17592 type:complete len:291 (-) Transcript_10136:650-1522(-)